MKMLQLHALALELIERRRVELFVAMTTQITPAHVIGEDEKDVGRGCLPCRTREKHAKAKEEKERLEVFHGQRIQRIK